MKHSNEGRKLTRGALALGVAMGLAGCAATPPPALEQARSEYRDAAQDPHVSRYAPVALHDAENALQKAEQALQRDQDRVPHLAYLARQRVEIARAHAQKAMAIQRMDELAQQREQVLLDARGQEAQQARQRSQQLERELQELKARETERGTEVTLRDVLFATDRAELKSGAMMNLQPLVDYLKANPQRDLLIEGHTDSVGPEQYNLELSRSRASAVRDFFLAQGIPSERMTIQGYGERYPVAPNDNEAGRQQNRRVNLVILKEGQDARQILR